jgi:hypothetical protein
MPEPMSAILRRVAAINSPTPKSFAAAFDDFDFDGTATRQEMRAFWELAHNCLEASDKSLDRRTAMFAMSGFAEVGPSAAFPKLNVKVIMFQMILRLLKPERVHQRVFGICGPSHFVVLLIKSKPLKYVSMAMDLLTKGKTIADDGFEIVPDKYVMDFDPQQTISQADWLLAASLRNAQIPIPGKELGTYSGTNAPEVFAYFKHAGYERIVLLSCYQRATDWMAHSVASSFYERFEPAADQKMIEGFAAGGKTHDPVTNFRVACKLREIGWRVMLMTNGDLFKFDPITTQEREAAKGGKPFDVTRLALKQDKWNEIVTEKTLSPGIYAQNVNHWVLAKDIAVRGEEVKLTVYTWGSQYTLNAAITLKEFSNCYSGFVAAFG